MSIATGLSRRRLCTHTISVALQISAKQGTGIDDLLETVLLLAEVEQLTANPERLARGTVVEAHLDRRMGSVATMLVATGTLKVGDVLHAGASYGKVSHHSHESLHNICMLCHAHPSWFLPVGVL